MSTYRHSNMHAVMTEVRVTRLTGEWSVVEDGGSHGLKKCAIRTVKTILFTT